MSVLGAVFENLNLGPQKDTDVLIQVVMRALTASVEKVDTQGIELIVLAVVLGTIRYFTSKGRDNVTPPTNVVKREPED